MAFQRLKLDLEHQIRALAKRVMGTCCSGPAKADEASDLPIRGISEVATNEVRIENLSAADFLKAIDHRPTENAEGNNLGWLNFIMLRLWPSMDKALKDFLNQVVFPKVKAVVPGLEFDEISLGTNPPLLGPIEASWYEGGTARGLCLDVRFEWNCNTQIGIRMGPIPAGLKELKVSGQVKVILRPIMERLPVVGGVQITMTAPPDIDYDVTGVMNVLDMGPLKRTIKEKVQEILSEILVLPNRIFVHWLQGQEGTFAFVDKLDFTSFKCPPPLFLLKLGVTEASELEGKDWALIGKATSDPYAIIQVSQTEKRTPTISSNCNPKWGEDGWCDYLVYEPDQLLTVNVWDHDLTSMADHLGYLQCSLDEILTTPSGWWPLAQRVKEEPDEKDKTKKVETKPKETKPPKPTREKTPGVPQICVQSRRYRLLPQWPQPLQGSGEQWAKGAPAIGVLGVLIRCLEGLKTDVSAGAIISFKIGGKDYKTKPSEILPPTTVFGLLGDEVVDFHAQRLVEHMANEKRKGKHGPITDEDLQDIGAIADLSLPTVQSIIYTRPSFLARWEEVIYIPIVQTDNIEIKTSLSVPSKPELNAEQVVPIKLAGRDKSIHEFEELVDLTNNTKEGNAKKVNYKLDMKILLYSIEELGPRAEVRKTSGSS